MLDTDQLKRLRVLVTPAAWTAHEALSAGERVDPEEAMAVYGDLRLVAAGILRAVALSAQQASAQASEAKVKRFRVEGEYEEEYFGSTDAQSAQAAAWLQLAQQLERVNQGKITFATPTFVTRRCP